MAQNLAPLPQPGFSIYPGLLATKPETFLSKGRDVYSDRASFLISYLLPNGEAGTPFLDIVEEQRKQISFRTMQGQEVMKIVKQKHNWSGKATEYHGMRGEGNELWYLKLRSGSSGTEYQLRTNDPTAAASNIIVQNKVNGAQKGILVNGQPGATMSKHGEWKHVHRHDIINVAPGMDMLLALGVNWIRADKAKQDAKTAVSAAT